MNRRKAFLLIAAAVAAPSLAHAQKAEAMGQAETDHAMRTLAAGGTSLETSKIAQSKAQNAWVKKFAEYEVAEQTTIAEILKSMGAKPAEKDDKQKAMVDKLGKSSAFDADYLSGQLEGHTELLKIQDDYIAKGKNPAHVSVAKLARGQIKEHIDLIQTIQKGMKA